MYAKVRSFLDHLRNAAALQPSVTTDIQRYRPGMVDETGAIPPMVLDPEGEHVTYADFQDFIEAANLEGLSGRRERMGKIILAGLCVLGGLISVFISGKTFIIGAAVGIAIGMAFAVENK